MASIRFSIRCFDDPYRALQLYSNLKFVLCGHDGHEARDRRHPEDEGQPNSTDSLPSNLQFCRE